MSVSYEAWRLPPRLHVINTNAPVRRSCTSARVMIGAQHHNVLRIEELSIATRLFQMVQHSAGSVALRAVVEFLADWIQRHDAWSKPISVRATSVQFLQRPRLPVVRSL